MVTKRTPKELYNKSVELYNNIRKKGKNGQSSKWAYYYCKCILNGKKDVPQKFVQADAKNVTGQSINEKILLMGRKTQIITKLYHNQR